MSSSAACGHAPLLVRLRARTPPGEWDKRLVIYAPRLARLRCRRGPDARPSRPSRPRELARMRIAYIIAQPDDGRWEQRVLDRIAEARRTTHAHVGACPPVGGLPESRPGPGDGEGA